MAKRGRKTRYETYSGEEVKAIISGKEYGVKLHKSSKNYFAMLPCSTSPSGTKQYWLGSDIGIAVAKFWAYVQKIKTGKEIKIETQIEIITTPFPNYDLQTGEVEKNKVDYPIPESVFIEWLKKELKKPKELAKKTGISEFTEFGRLLAKDTNIPLKSLITNYLNKKKTISKISRQQAKRFFNTFIEIVECKNIDDISLKDIHKYEDYIHSQGLSSKSIKNQMNTVGTIINYNCGRYYSPHLIQVRDWIKGIDRPEEDKPYNPIIFILDDFNALYQVSPIKWKLFLLLGLNCAMNPIDIARLKIDNINMEEGTISFRRGKTGKVLAVSTLWERTKKLLIEYIEKERKINSKYVFVTKLGSPYSSKGITEAYDRTIRKNAKISKNVKFNHLRDTFATLAQDLGYPIEQINFVMGHQNKGVHDRYAVRNAKKLTQKMCNAVEKEFFKTNM